MLTCGLLYIVFLLLLSSSLVTAIRHEHIAVLNTSPESIPSSITNNVLSFDNHTHIVLDLSPSLLQHHRRSLMEYMTLEPNGPVKLASMDSTTTTTTTTTVQMDVPSWGLSRISQRQLPLTKAYGYPDQAGKDVDIYIVDSGVDIHHPDLKDRAIWGANFVAGSPDTDEHGHGTLIAGIAAGTTFGVAKKATLIAVKCLNINGTGDIAIIIQGLHYILQRIQMQSSPRAVVNLSLVAEKSVALNQALDALSRAGAMIVVAAGNYHQQVDHTTRNACRYSPASASTVISVGSTDENDQFASFSNDGPCVTLLAPGASILSLDDDGKTAAAVKTYYSGTSYSAPHVVGVIALLWALNNNNNKTRDQLIDHLYTLATPNVILNVTKGTSNRLVYNGVDTSQLPMVLFASTQQQVNSIGSRLLPTLFPTLLFFGSSFLYIVFIVHPFHPSFPFVLHL